MGENVFKMEILFSAQFTLSSVKNTKEVYTQDFKESG